MLYLWKKQSKQNKPRPNPQNSYNRKQFAFINTKTSHVFLISQCAYAFSNTAVALYLHLQCPYGPLAFPDEQARELIILEMILHVKVWGAFQKHSTSLSLLNQHSQHAEMLNK